MVDWGVVCLLAAYCGPLERALGCHCMRRGTAVNASQLPLPRLQSAAVQDCKWRSSEIATFIFIFAHSLPYCKNSHKRARYAKWRSYALLKSSALSRRRNDLKLGTAVVLDTVSKRSKWFWVQNVKGWSLFRTFRTSCHLANENKYCHYNCENYVDNVKLNYNISPSTWSHLCHNCNVFIS